MDVLGTYWGGVMQRLQAEVEQMNQLIDHQGTKGTENEKSLARLVQNLIPTRYGVGSGLLIDSTGSFSKQMDLIIYEQGNEPALLAQTNQVLFPVENVRLCIEVKTSLNKREIDDAREKKASIDALASSTGLFPPLALFAYRADIEAGTIADNLDPEMTDKGPRPDLTAVVSVALLVGDLNGTGEPKNHVRAVAVLQQQSADGETLINTAEAVLAEERGKSVARRKSIYPIVKVGSGYLIAEPSRALLLFSEWLIVTLAERDKTPVVLTAYINASARQLNPV